MHIEDFIGRHEGVQQQALYYLHELIASQTNLRPSVKYGLPFYSGMKNVCYIHPLKDGMIELCFLYGKELSNASGLLEMRGRKRIAGITIDPKADMPTEKIMETLFEAIALDEQIHATKS